MTPEAAQALLDYARAEEDWHRACNAGGSHTEFRAKYDLAPSVSVAAWLTEMRRKAIGAANETQGERG